MASEACPTLVCPHCARLREERLKVLRGVKFTSERIKPLRCYMLYTKSSCTHGKLDIHHPTALWKVTGLLPSLSDAVPYPSSPYPPPPLTIDAGRRFYYPGNGTNECFKVSAYGLLAMIPGFITAFMKAMQEKVERGTTEIPGALLHMYLTFIAMEQPGGDLPTGFTDGEFGTGLYASKLMDLTKKFVGIAPLRHSCHGDPVQGQGAARHHAVVDMERCRIHSSMFQYMSAFTHHLSNHFVLYVRRKGGEWYKFDSLGTTMTQVDDVKTPLPSTGIVHVLLDNVALSQPDAEKTADRFIHES